MDKPVFLAGASRTPIGAFNGVFAEFSTPKLGAAAVKAAVERAHVNPQDVDEVLIGNVLSAGLGQAVARQVLLGAGLPVSCGAVTINKMCGSAMRAIRMAAQAIRCGDSDVIVAGGAENMTQAPYLLPKGRGGYRLGDGEIIDSMVHDGLTDAYSGRHMGQHAEDCAKKYEITRAQQDDYAVASYQRVLAAQNAGHFRRTLVPVEIPGRKGAVVVEVDEEPTKFNEEKLRGLKPVFERDGTITAGNASSISDGAAAMVVVSAERAEAAGIRCDARIIGYASVAQEPGWFTTAPIRAIRRLCDRVSMKLDEFDLFEINEAFSVVPLVAMKELGLPHEKVNVLGGAVAIGHPIGASGARILVTLIDALRARSLRRGLATACIGGGEAGAMAIELVA